MTLKGDRPDCIGNKWTYRAMRWANAEEQRSIWKVVVPQYVVPLHSCLYSRVVCQSIPHLSYLNVTIPIYHYVMVLIFWSWYQLRWPIRVISLLSNLLFWQNSVKYSLEWWQSSFNSLLNLKRNGIVLQISCTSSTVTDNTGRYMIKYSSHFKIILAVKVDRPACCVKLVERKFLNILCGGG